MATDMAPAVAADSPPSQTAPTMKPIHSLVLDTGPLIKNDPPADVLRARAEVLYILPSVLPEIRDEATRTRVETTLLPFVTVRAPRPESVKHIQGFARRTGDLEVLSRPDLEVLALGYELECERNGGSWRLRDTPGQKTVNGKPPHREGQAGETTAESCEDKGETPLDDGLEKLQIDASESADATTVETQNAQDTPEAAEKAAGPSSTELPTEEQQPTEKPTQEPSSEKPSEESSVEKTVEEPSAEKPAEETTPSLTSGEKPDETVEAVEVVEEDESDGEGWITPSNIQKHKAKDTSSSAKNANGTPVTLQAAILTSDYAMQNVALRMNLNLVSPELTRISRLRTWVLRCHACFQITRAMERRFCPSCGQPTLLRAACTVDDRTGQLTVHLKKNFQWNNRGNVYSVPKPVHGTSNGRAPRGSSASNGGTGGWGRELILAEDQKEFVRAAEDQKRAQRKALDVMDQDYLPGILGGGRSSAGGKIRVGAGRNINSRKKR